MDWHDWQVLNTQCRCWCLSTTALASFSGINDAADGCTFLHTVHLNGWHVHVATGLLELKTLIPFCIDDRAYLVKRAPVVCFSPHKSLMMRGERNIVITLLLKMLTLASKIKTKTNCMYGVMSSSVHFSRSVKRWLKRSSVSSGRSSTRSRQMVSGRELRSTRATLWKSPHILY